MEANRLNGKKGGRPKGTRNHEIGALNRKFLKSCPEALETLLWHMRHSENDAIRVACAREILDRGLGRPVRSIDRQAGQILDQLCVITGVPRSSQDPDGPAEIEGEKVGEGVGADG